MIGHLTKDGKLKGNADVGHLIDVECSLTKLVTPKIKDIHSLSNLEQIRHAITMTPGMFKFEIRKNRYGPSGGWAIFRHIDTGIKFIDSSFGMDEATFKETNDWIEGRDQPTKQTFWQWLTS